MSQIITRGIQNNAVTGEKVRLNNNQSFRARNAANNADVELFKLNSSDELEFLPLPKYSGSNIATEDYVDTELGNYVPLTEKGANNGVATLDAGGKIPANQLPSTVVEYKGAWDASTNTPTLADGTGDAGDIYIVSVAGTQDLGSGNITFATGDWAIYNGAEWEKSINSNAVQSVNGQQGAVTLDSDDINEGSSNLYFTDARAKTATVVNSMAGNETDQAPSVDSVKQYVADQSANVIVQTFTLSAGDITNGFITLSSTPDQILDVTPKGFPSQHPVDDYTISGADLTFAGDMLSLIAGDKLKVVYSV